MKKAIDPTTCFTNRAGHYVRSRPDYPAEMLQFSQHRLGLSDARPNCRYRLRNRDCAKPVGGAVRIDYDTNLYFGHLTMSRAD
jgi:hypothetical protein